MQEQLFKIVSQQLVNSCQAYCCNLSAGVERSVHHEQNVHEQQYHIYVAQTSNNTVITACDLYCCLLPQFEALCTCRSGFLIATT